jgi:hypothetical protein
MKKFLIAATLVVAATGLSACSGAGAQQVGVQGQVGVGVINPAPVYNAPPVYGYGQGYQQQSRRVVGQPIAPQRTVTEHPPGTSNQYRCFADRRPSGGPGTGTGWCD